MRLRFAIRDLLWLTVVIAAISSIKLHVGRADDFFDMKNWAPDVVHPGPGSDTHLISVHGLRTKVADRISIGMTIEIGMDNPLAPLPRAGSARYSAVPPRLYEGDMIPISGQLYAVAELAEPRNDGSDAFFQLHRVEYERYPEDVFPPSLTAYPFPLNEDTKSRGQSGTLNGYYIFVKEIKRAQRLTEETQARVGVLEKGNRDEATPIHRWNEIAWSWVRTGDVLQLGVVKRLVTRIVAPVPVNPSNPGQGRMIGWIELDSNAKD